MKTMLRHEDGYRFAQRLCEMLGLDVSVDADVAVLRLLERAKAGDMGAVQLFTEMLKRYAPDRYAELGRMALQSIAETPELQAALAKIATEEQMEHPRGFLDNSGRSQ